jgi:hypothetical protein
MSQGDVARKLSWSLSKVQRIEGGEVAVSVTDLKALLELYDVTDQHQIDRLTADARIARRQRWVVPPEHRVHLSSALRQLMQFETEAAVIRAYQPVLIPGVLQTPEVAEIVLSWGNRMSDEDRRVRYDVRMARRRQIVDNEHGPEFRVILDESVINRPIGNADIMAAQLESLVTVAERPRVRIRVVPLKRSAEVGLADAFQILNLSGDEDDGVVYREWYDGDGIQLDPDDVRYYRRLFDDMWEISLPEQATIRAVTAEAMRLRSSLDRAS